MGIPPCCGGAGSSFYRGVIEGASVVAHRGDGQFTLSASGARGFQMRRVTFMGLCLMAVLVSGAVAAAGASAQAPEYGRCLKAEKIGNSYTGKFSNSGCTTEVPEAERAKKGKYEWYPGVLKGKQTSKGGKAILEEAGRYAVGCESEESTGEYSGTKDVRHVIVKFKKCQAPGLVCTSEGHEKGELETVPLEGRVVWENESKHKAAFDLFPEGGGEFIEFNCGGTLTVAVRGSILVPVTVDKMSDTVTLKYVGKKGVQKVQDYEEGGVKVKDILEANFAGKGFLQASQTVTSTVTNEEELELNAYV
jgi:hypothetical protein